MFQGSFLKSFSYKNNQILCCSLNQFLSAFKRNSPFIKFKSTVVADSTVKDKPAAAVNCNSTSKTYFREYFLNNKDIYSSYVDIYNISTGNDTNFESLKLLKDFINNKEDKELQEKLEKSIKSEISSYDLEDIFKYVAVLKKSGFTRPSYKNKKKLIKYLDEELLQRKLSYQDTLKMLHVCCELPFYRKLKFTFKKLSKFLRNISNFSLQEVVQIMYCVTNLDKNVLNSSKYNIHSYFVENIPKLNSDELGIIAVGLLKCKLNFTHKDIASSIINKTLEEIENMQMIPFSCICQCLYRFLNTAYVEELYKFQERLIPYAPKIKGPYIIMVVKTGLKLRFMNLSLWETLANDFKREIKNYNLDQIERFVNATTVYNIEDEELLNLAIKEFEEKSTEYTSYHVLILFLNDLIHHQLYPKNLLGRVLSKGFTNEFDIRCRFADTRKHYFFLCNSVEIEKPTYNFELLSDEKRKILFKGIKYQSNENDKHLFIKNVKTKKILQDIYGESSVYLTRCIPHNEPGIIMRFDKSLKAQPIPEEFKRIEDFQIKRPLRDDHFWIFLRVFITNQVLNGTNSLSFEFQTEIRLLKILGFKPVTMISGFLNKRSKQTDVDDWLKDLLNHSLKEFQHDKSD